MKRAFRQHGDVLTFQFRVPGFSEREIGALAGEIICQAEASDDHPDAQLVTVDEEEEEDGREEAELRELAYRKDEGTLRKK